MSEQTNENDGIVDKSGTYWSKRRRFCPNGQSYTVQSGDTMFAIAGKYNISLQTLIEANPQISDPDLIYPGERLCIPITGPATTCPEGRTYQVVSGDTMYGIARRFGLNLDDLVRVNPQIADPARITPGQLICIPEEPVGSCQGGTLYTVQAGDTMFDIAHSNNISLAALIAANPQITNPDRIFPGQVICIPSSQPQPVPLPTPLPTLPAGEFPTTAPEEPPIFPAVPLPAMPAVPARIQPCPPVYGQVPVYTMPVYVMIPWEEWPCKKRDRRGWRCR